MIDTVNQLVKQGKLSEAAELLLSYAQEIPADDEIIQDIIVLSGSLSDLKRRLKRKKISPQEAGDARIRLSYDLTDIVEKLPGSSGGKLTPSPATNVQHGGGGTPPATPVINNQIEININIENHINNEMKVELQAVKQGFDELKTQLLETEDDGAREAVKEIEALAQNLDCLEKATSKDQLPSHLEKVAAFFKRLEDGNDYISGAIKTAKNGAAIAQELAKNYNSIAQWVGLPVVPPVLLGD